MKQIYIIILASIASVFVACTKETSLEQTATAPQEVGVEGDIVCIDGTLHFPSPESCFKTMDALVSDEDLHAFEKSIILHPFGHLLTVCWTN